MVTRNAVEDIKSVVEVVGVQTLDAVTQDQPSYFL
jgi:hypothetical protein